jgi:hypothetical protein
MQRIQDAREIPIMETTKVRTGRRGEPKVGASAQLRWDAIQRLVVDVQDKE